jgi:hypothetical protein
MRTSPAMTAIFLGGCLFVLPAIPSSAQHSSGGTPPSVTEGQQGQTGSKTQGVPGSGWNPNDRASGSQPSGGSAGGMGSGSGSGGNSGVGSGSGMGSGGYGSGSSMGSGGSSSGGGMGSGSGGSGGR